ncbi:MAG: choice-of-anchor D domain-containing protein, partial [bacterium]
MRKTHPNLFIYSTNNFFLIVLTFLSLICSVNPSRAQGESFSFSVMGDAPYGDAEFPAVQKQIDDHNLYSPSEFVLHVGDIMKGGCREVQYIQVADQLKTLQVPVFIVPGDNEWTDCSNENEAWAFWSSQFLSFENNFCGAPATEHQNVRPENLAFVHKGVLIVGVNLPNGRESGYQTRLRDSADWVTQQFQAYADQVRAAVVFGQSTVGDVFFNQFRAAAVDFSKPVLYVHGDGHSWRLNNPWLEANIVRVQIDRANAPFVQVTVNQNSFSFERNPWGPDSVPINRPPCGPGPNISVDPSSHEFGNVAVNGSTANTFTVTNTGDENLTVSNVSFNGNTSGAFNLDSGGSPFSLFPNQTHDVVVSFNPTIAGGQNATLRFESNDPHDNPLDVNLSGSGMPLLPDIAVNPTSHDFGGVPAGSSASQTFVVRNAGTAVLNVSAVSLTGPQAGDFQIPAGGGAFALAPGSTHNLEVVFLPTSDEQKNAVLSLQSDDPDENPFEINLVGNQPLPPCDPNVNIALNQAATASSGDLPPGNVTDGDNASRWRSARLNTSNQQQWLQIDFGQTIALGRILLRWKSTRRAVSYALQTSNDGANWQDIYAETAGAGSQDDLTGIAGSGQYVRLLMTQSNSSRYVLYEFQIFCPTGPPPPPEPNIAVNPPAHDFGAVAIGSSANQTFVVGNTGNDVLDVSGISLVGVDAGDFQITAGGGAVALTPGASQNVTVQFQPASEGAKSAALRLNSNDPHDNPLDVNLSGSGMPLLPDIAV